MTLPPLKLTVPLAPLPAADTTRVSPSTSPSLATTVTLPGVSSAVVSVSSPATGASLTLVTTSVNCTGAERPLSPFGVPLAPLSTSTAA